MLTVICGQDTVSSRQYFKDLKTKYQRQNFEIEMLSPERLFQLRSWLSQSISLFGYKKVFFIENLFKTVVKQNKKGLKEVSQIAKDPLIKLIDWEDGLQSWQVKTEKKNIKEFKPSSTIFKLLDSVYPRNKKDFLYYLNKVTKNTDEYLVFFMLIKHIRGLILAKENILPDRLQLWQKKKLLNQSNLWDLQKLISFYQALYRIDIKIKTSLTPFSIKASLDILACYYL